MASEREITQLKIAIANAELTIENNRETIQSLTDELSNRGEVRYYNEDSVRRAADTIVREARGQNVKERLERLFLERQALPALDAILACKDDGNRDHFSFETCRMFASWIRAREETYACGRVMHADNFLREFASRVGCETVMTEHNPLFFRGGYQVHCSRGDFANRVARFVQLIASPVSFEEVHSVLGL